MQTRRPGQALLLLLLLLLPTARPASSAERTPILLYPFGSSTSSTPEPVPLAVAQLVRDELQKGGRYAVSIRDPESPIFRRAESERPSPDPTQLHQALDVARGLGARYIVQGLITAYDAPQAGAPGKITFRITVAATETDVSRDVFVTEEMKVGGQGPTASAKVLGPAARAVAAAIVTEALPGLERAAPADRLQAAQRARERASEATAHGSTGQSVGDLRRAAQLVPGDTGTHIALGEALVKQGMEASALLEFRQALALEEAIRPGVSLDGASRSEGRSGPASGPGSVSISTISPSSAHNSLRLRLIRALEDRGLWDEAVAEARRGLERQPDAEPLRLALAEALVRGGDGAGALAELQALHRTREPRGTEWELLAAGYALAGDAPRWLDAMVRGAVAGQPESNQYAAVIQRLDLAFQTQVDAAAEAERRTLVGQISPAEFGAEAGRQAAQAKSVAAYMGRLAFPEDAAAAHQAREAAWGGLERAAEHAVQFAGSGGFDDLAAARGERLRAAAQLNGVRDGTACHPG